VPQIETWSRLLPAIRNNLVERRHDRNISLDDLNRLRLRIEVQQPIVPDGMWFKDFGSFQLCGEGKLPKTFLLAGQIAKGHELNQFLFLAGTKKLDAPPALY
jgi:hypothetical protein